ncbi:MAG TPA: response regulator transcription factor [Clostridia bacterium]|nr:response regulator transcription factor [Clostridia bacterium]
MPKIRVLIADDHALVRSGLRALLAAQSDIEVVGEAADGVGVIEACRKYAPQVVLMDLSMPGRGGIGATQDLHQTFPEVKVLVVTMHEDGAYVRQALLAGASGCVFKKSLADELITAIRAVFLGQQHIPSTLARDIDKNELAHSRGRQGANLLATLTPREREVISLAALGYTNSEIARQLHISDKTVETHRMHSVTKLGLRTRADLVRFAIEHGLIST